MEHAPNSNRMPPLKPYRFSPLEDIHRRRLATLMALSCSVAVTSVIIQIQDGAIVEPDGLSAAIFNARRVTGTISMVASFLACFLLTASLVVSSQNASKGLPSTTFPTPRIWRAIQLIYVAAMISRGLAIALVGVFCDVLRHGPALGEPGGRVALIRASLGEYVSGDGWELTQSAALVCVPEPGGSFSRNALISVMHSFFLPVSVWVLLFDRSLTEIFVVATLTVAPVLVQWLSSAVMLWTLPHEFGEDQVPAYAYNRTAGILVIAVVLFVLLLFTLDVALRMAVEAERRAAASKSAFESAADLAKNRRLASAVAGQVAHDCVQLVHAALDAFREQFPSIVEDSNAFLRESPHANVGPSSKTTSFLTIVRDSHERIDTDSNPEISPKAIQKDECPTKLLSDGNDPTKKLLSEEGAVPTTLVLEGGALKSSARASGSSAIRIETMTTPPQSSRATLHVTSLVGDDTGTTEIESEQPQKDYHHHPIQNTLEAPDDSKRTNTHGSGLEDVAVAAPSFSSAAAAGGGGGGGSKKSADRGRPPSSTDVKVSSVGVSMSNASASAGLLPAPQRMYAALRMALRLLGDSLDMVAVAEGRLKQELHELDFADTVRTAVSVARGVGDVGVSFRVGPPPGPDWTLLFDPIRVEQVLLNTLSNAVKKSPTGSNITVTLRSFSSASELMDARSHRPFTLSFSKDLAGRSHALSDAVHIPVDVRSDSTANHHSGGAVVTPSFSQTSPTTPHQARTPESLPAMAGAGPDVAWVLLSVEDEGTGLEGADPVRLFHEFERNNLISEAHTQNHQSQIHHTVSGNTVSSLSSGAAGTTAAAAAANPSRNNSSQIPNGISTDDARQLDRRRGRGLGLAMVARITSLLEGAVELADRRRTAGAVVNFAFPAKLPHAILSPIHTSTNNLLSPQPTNNNNTVPAATTSPASPLLPSGASPDVNMDDLPPPRQRSRSRLRTRSARVVPEKPLRLAGKNIAYIDDDPLMRHSVKQSLAQARVAEAIEFSKAEDAILYLQNPDHTVPHAILCDVDLGSGMDGPQFVAALQQRDIHIPVVANTGAAGARETEYLLTAGFAAVASKAAGRPSLYAALHKVL